MESALQERNPEPRDVYDTFFRFQEAFNEMLEVLPSYKILPDAREIRYLNKLLDKWLQLTGTIDTDIARYPVWRQVADLVGDLEASNPELWSNRVQPLLQLLQHPDYAPPLGIHIREPRFDHMPLRRTRHTV